MKEKILSKLPSVDTFLQQKNALPLIEKFGRENFVQVVREELEQARKDILQREKEPNDEKDFSLEILFLQIEARLKTKYFPSLRKAINGTGIILHTGLGRAKLSEDAQKAIAENIEGYCTLAADIESGRRGHRDSHLDDLISEVTGAESATVVNNNAAATVLVLNSLAKGKEVIVSRGQLVEIGGAFRMPDVMETSGAVMREVGTTNKTHLRDYAAAINEDTGAILRVHHSNFRIVGFFSEPGIDELVELGRKHQIPVIDDLGSGALVDLAEFGLESEPLVQKSIKAGVDVSCFSGDKLIGGPQSGVIVGKKDMIEKIRKNPLARAFRIGKMTIAGMEATIKLFLNPEKLKERHPTYRMFSLSLQELEQRASLIVKNLKKKLKSEIVSLSIIDGESQVGSGSVPAESIPTKLLKVSPLKKPAGLLACELRRNRPAVFSRVQKDSVLLDLRTIQPEEDIVVQNILYKLLSGEEKT